MKAQKFKFILIVLGALIFQYCKKKAVCENQTDPVIEISTNTLVADGVSESKITVNIPGNASKDKRSISFKTSGGLFKENKLTNTTSDAISKASEVCYLQTAATLVAPTISGPITISVTINDETYTREVQVVNSEPAKIKLNLNSFAVKTGFGSEISFTAHVTNSVNANASSGYKVLFEDYYYNQQPVNGQFRDLKTTTNETSLASGIYSPGFAPADTFVYLKATLFDKAGNKTQIRDSIKIFIINNQ